MPGQADKLRERRWQSPSATGAGVSVEGDVGVINTFCLVLSGLK